MKVEPLPIEGAWLLTPTIHGDDRGSFVESFTQAAVLPLRGRPFAVAQANVSISRAGALRGVHFADVPPGQAKYVTCLHGEVLDVVVDIRLGSPTFGRSAGVRLRAEERQAVLISEGLGHAFLALTDDATVHYLCSTGYDPQREHGIHPLDADLALPWPADVTPLLSPKDAAAPSLAEARAAGLLPRYPV